MARINISQLHPAGSELFHDTESFLDDLTSQETGSIAGGDGVGAILSNAAVYTYVIDTPVVKNVETQFVHSKNTVSVGISLQTYSVFSPA